MAQDAAITLNQVRLSADPELQGVGTPGERCKFRVLWDQGRDDKKETVGIDVTVFGKSAAIVANTLRKGWSVTVNGRLEINTRTNDAGEKRTFFGVVADPYKGVIFGQAPRGESNGNGNGAPASQPEAAAVGAADDFDF